MVDNELDYGLLTEWDGGVATGVGKEGNWYDAVTNKNAPVTNASISATGGDDVSSFYASLGYNKTEATVITSDFKRITGALNYSRKLASKVKFAINTNVSNTYQNAYLEQAAYFANPNLAKYFMSPWEQPYKEDGTPDTDIWVGIFNPIYLAEHDINANDYTRALVNSSLEWDIIKDLKFRTFVSADYNLANYKQYQNRIHGDAAQEGGYAYASAERNFNTVFQNSLDYTLRFSDHNLSFKALIEYQKNKNHFLWGSGENFSTDGLQILPAQSKLMPVLLLTTGTTFHILEWQIIITEANILLTLHSGEKVHQDLHLKTDLVISGQPVWHGMPAKNHSLKILNS